MDWHFTGWMAFFICNLAASIMGGCISHWLEQEDAKPVRWRRRRY